MVLYVFLIQFREILLFFEYGILSWAAVSQEKRTSEGDNVGILSYYVTHP